MIKNNSKVVHNKFGNGTVLSAFSDSVLVRFEDNTIQQCPLKDVSEIEDINSFFSKAKEIDADYVLAKIQAELIQTLNNKWGVFSRSAIDLLPHQLWVCNQVLKEWPVRYLVADDVGLGKTIEAGLIIWGLKEARKIQRILILVPAPLTYQWAERMQSLFDLNFQVYQADNANPLNSWLGTPKYIIASASTLQMNKTENQKKRQSKLFDSEPWDLVIVDEAHHMNYTERQGPTLEYQLFEELNKVGKIISTVLFTGTPHRGFDFGFWKLMKLVAPMEFDSKLNATQQYEKLSKYFIRNNKADTVDMKGNKLFKPIHQYPKVFSYSIEESEFYNKMTAFIAEGKAYSKTLSGQELIQVQLVLCALQKIASSSIYAVKCALENRCKKLIANQNKKVYIPSDFDDLDIALKEDESYEEKSNSVQFVLMKNEIENLKELINTAARVNHESRIDKIIEIIESDYPNENILFFTEYKKTQSLLMTELMKKWGKECVTFINGDESLLNVILPDGTKKRFDKKRVQAANEFNEGEKRFLISTEAAGEGIDLQKNCHVIIHVDLPWNPMRLHQRVGRINRYGQKYEVDVISLRNPDTIESMLWTKLESKIDNIQKAFSAGMDNPEDMMQMVLGMQSSQYFSNLFSEGLSKDKNSISDWFDSYTQTFGNKNAIETIQKLVGNAAKFNLSELPEVPKVDLPDLLPFFKRVLKLNGRQLSYENDSYSFITPDEWLKSGIYGIMPRYRNIIFRRKLKNGESSKSIAGIGFSLFDKALDFANRLTESVACISENKSYFIYKIFDQKTYSDKRITKDLIVISYEQDNNLSQELSLDNALKIMNTLSIGDYIENYMDEIPCSVEKIANDRLYKYNFELPALELKFVLFCKKRGMIKKYTNKR